MVVQVVQVAQEAQVSLLVSNAQALVIQQSMVTAKPWFDIHVNLGFRQQHNEDARRT